MNFKFLQMISFSELGFPVYAALGFFGTTILSLLLIRVYLTDSTPFFPKDESNKKKAAKKDLSKNKSSQSKNQNAPKKVTSHTPASTSSSTKTESAVNDGISNNLMKGDSSSLAVKNVTAPPRILPSDEVEEVQQKTVIPQQAAPIHNKKVVEDVAKTPEVRKTPSPVKQLSKIESKTATKIEKSSAKDTKAAPQVVSAPKPSKGEVKSAVILHASQSKPTIVSELATSELKEISKPVTEEVQQTASVDTQAGVKKKKKKGKKDSTDELHDTRETSSSPKPETITNPSPLVTNNSSVSPTVTASDDIINPYVISLRRRLAENVNLVDQMRKEITDVRKEITDKNQEMSQVKIKLAEQMTGNQRLREQNMQLLEKHNALEQQWNILQNQFAVNVLSLEQTKKRLEAETKMRLAVKPVEPPPPVHVAPTFTSASQTSESSLALKELQKENATLMQDVAAGKKVEVELRARLQQLVEEQNRKHEIEQQLFSVKSMVDIKDKEIHKLHATVQDLNSRIDVLKQNEVTANQVREQELKALRSAASPTKVERSYSQDNEQKLKEMENQITTLNDEIAKQREKNDVLRQRNWSVMNRIKDLEKLQSDSNCFDSTSSRNTPLQMPSHSEHETLSADSDEQLKSSSPAERGSEYLAKQKKIQEELEALKSKNNEIRQRNWNIMEELTSTRDKLEKQNLEVKRLAAEVAESAVLRDEAESLKMQLNSCTRVLTNTEHILATLQSSVEEEETKWRCALEASEMECDKARGELQRVYYELQRLQGNTDMTSKISRLTSELSIVIAERDQQKLELQQLQEQQLNETNKPAQGKKTKEHPNVRRDNKSRTNSATHHNGAV